MDRLKKENTALFERLSPFEKKVRSSGEVEVASKKVADGGDERGEGSVPKANYDRVLKEMVVLDEVVAQRISGC